MANEKKKTDDGAGLLRRGPVAGAQKPGRGVDFSRSNVARYIQLATLYRRRIETGEWPVGKQIPTIDVLMTESGVARDTVRQALSVLERESLVERFRAKGTFVRSRPRFNQLFDISADIPGLFWVREGMTVEILSGPDSGPLPAGTDAAGEFLPQYVHHRKRHWRSEIPFLVTDNYYETGTYARIPPADWETKGALSILIGRSEVAIGDIRQTLTITTADIETATLLQLPLNAPVARVQRVAVNLQGQIIYFGDGLYRGENIRLDIKLK